MGAADHDLEELMSYMGSFGKYQIIQFLLLALASVNAGIHMLSLVVVAATPGHRCFIPGVDDIANGTVHQSPWNSSEVLKWLPLKNDNTTDNCHFLNPNTSEKIACDTWIWDGTYHPSSLVIDQTIVCDRRWMGALAQCFYMLGLLFGSLLLGNKADVFGRKPVFCAAAVLQLVVGVVLGYVTEFYSLLGLRFLYGIGTVGTLSASFVLIMEMVPPSYRTTCGMAFQSFFSIGIALLAFWGYMIRDHQLLQAICGLHGALLLPQYWLVDESARWLYSQGRFKDAVNIVSKASRMNHGDRHKEEIANFLRKDSTAINSTDKESTPEPPSIGFLDLFKTPNMCKRMFNVSFNWFANSLVYYGLSLNTGSLFGNPFLLLLIAGIVDVPSYTLTGIFMNRIGRRFLIASLLVLSGTACITACYIPEDIPGGKSIGTGVVMLGKFFVAGSFAIIYNYTTELFPTVVRNTALGASSMCARISGASAPFIALLDTFDKTLPSTIFGCVAIAAGLLALRLPETLGRQLPQSMEDGEHFGDNDLPLLPCLWKQARSRQASLRHRQDSTKDNHPDSAMETLRVSSQ